MDAKVSGLVGSGGKTGVHRRAHRLLLQLMRDLQKISSISRIKIYEEGKVAICEYEDEKHRLNYDRESYGVKKCNLPGDAWDDLVTGCQKASVTPDFVDFDVWETNPSSCQLFMHRSPLYFGSLLQTTLPWYGSMAFLTAIAMSRKKPEHWAVFQGNPAGKWKRKVQTAGFFEEG